MTGLIVRRAAASDARADHPVFLGDVRTRPILSDQTASGLALAEVEFVDGARTRWHRHPGDQVLVVTEGTGILADRAQEHVVSAGDVVIVPAGTEHWHGCRPGGRMRHLMVLEKPGSEYSLDAEDPVPGTPSLALDPRLTDPDAARLVAEITAARAGLPPRHLGTVEAARGAVRSVPGPVADAPAVVTGLAVDGLRPLRTYRPLDERPWGVVVYAHGGGWVVGDLDINDRICRCLAADAGLLVVSVDYRLAPEHPFPAGLDDTAAVLDWADTAEGRATLGVDAGTELLVGGFSAGGAFAAALARRSRDGRAPAVTQQLLLSPVLDADLETASMAEFAEGVLLSRDDMAWFWDLYDPTGVARNDPDDGVPGTASDLEGLAPAVVLVSGADPLRDSERAYAARLDAAGVAVRLVETPGVPHGYPVMPSIRAGRGALREVAATVRAHRALAPQGERMPS